MHVLGLQRVPTADLKSLLLSIHRGTIACPLTATELACIGLQHRSEDLLTTLRGQEESAVRVILVCVLAERMPRQ
jgi:hypothetical protein